MKDNGVILEKKEGAKAFLSEVWDQISSLFFERTGYCFEPLADEKLKKRQRRAFWMYRAIGRLIAFSLIHGIQIPRKILPPLLWVHLFRGTDYDTCFQSFAFKKRAHEEYDVEELCKAYNVARLEENEDYDSFMKRIYPVILDHAKTEENRYRSSRNLSWTALKDGFEYSRVPFDSKQKYVTNLQERLSFSVRDCVASDPWTAAASILGGEYMEERS